MTSWAELRRALGAEPLPAALVDLDALDGNLDRIAALVRASGKTLRLATKSVRAPALVDRIKTRGGFVGLMTYTAEETAFWAERGERDLLLAYPTVAASDLAHLVSANRTATAAVVVDCEEHVLALSNAARAAGAKLPAAIDLDVAFRRGKLYVGVRRSPLRGDAAIALAERVARDPHLTFHGVMAYEAQIAGVGDHGVGLKGPAMRLFKATSKTDVASARGHLVAELSRRGLPCTVVNGGGSGSLISALRENALTEVTAGSGFLVGHLFDHYAEISFTPAAYFALQVVRRPAPDVVTCHGGGFVASGAAGFNRLPAPIFPPGLTLLPFEGAGEVQTPLKVPPSVALAIGDPVFFRHAKAGELAEHVREYMLVRGDRIEDRVPTYRGLGRCFLG